METDFTVQSEGSIFLLRPNTAEAKEWCDEYLPENAMRWADSIVVEYRYIIDMVDGIAQSGLTAE